MQPASKKCHGQCRQCLNNGQCQAKSLSEVSVKNSCEGQMPPICCHINTFLPVPFPCCRCWSPNLHLSTTHSSGWFFCWFPPALHSSATAGWLTFKRRLYCQSCCFLFVCRFMARPVTHIFGKGTVSPCR